MSIAKRPTSRSAAVRTLLPAAAGFLLVSLIPARAERVPLPPAEQEKVNDAITQGVRFLKKTQLADGSWTPVGTPHRVGYTALPGLTLLECGEPLDDPVVKKAIHCVRRCGRELDATYELALSILLLDRVGDAKDRDLIQTMALRLVAGQTMTGGWGYKCPTISPQRQKELLVVLRKLNPRPGPGFLAREKPPAAGPGAIPARPGKEPAAGPGAVAGGPGALAGVPGKEPAPARDPASGVPATTNIPPGPDKSPYTSGTSGGSPSGDAGPTTAPGAPASSAKAGAGVAPLPDPKDPRKEDPKGKPNPPPAGKEEPRKEAPVVIPEAFRHLPVLQDPERHVLEDPPKRDKEKVLATTDNSNTQFAMLALWVAQRYDVPMERTMNLIVRRFQTSQNANGSWGYRYRFGGGEQERNTMDCVGLIGLAVGHGISQPAADNGGAVVRKNVQDLRILNGFLALSRHVGQPAGRMFNLEQVNLYYLWSLERVAVIYGLPTIGNKDWYRWGAEMLVANQQPLGNWTAGQYHGASPVLDTCMALLFLKKANLVRDLAARLPIDPDELVKAMDRELSTIPARLPPAPPPAEPPAPQTPPESPKVAEPLVEIPPPQAAPPPVSPPAGDGSRKLWGYLLLGVFLLLALLSGALVWQYSTQRKRQPGVEKNGSRKGGKTVRKDSPRAAKS
jgi:hypothetical protein